jgi:hypothetical protein
MPMKSLPSLAFAPSGPVHDELCVKAGVEKIKDRLTP